MRPESNIKDSQGSYYTIVSIVDQDVYVIPSTQDTRWPATLKLTMEEIREYFFVL